MLLETTPSAETANGSESTGPNEDCTLHNLEVTQLGKRKASHIICKSVKPVTPRL